MKYLLGTDIGTSSTKTIIMDTEGDLIHAYTVEYDVLTPKNLWAEQHANVWHEALEQSILNVISESKINPDDIIGISISGLYGGSGIPVNKNIEPLRPCLIWMDRRADEESRQVISKGLEDEIRSITRSGTDPYYGYLKILWVKNNEPHIWKNIRYFLPPNAYSIYRLTGEIAIDYSSAGNIGGVFDSEKRTWSKTMMDKLGIPISMMPKRIVTSDTIVGYVTEEASKKTGLKKGTPVIAGGVDCAVATLGMGVYDEDIYATTIGTSMCAAYVHKEESISDDLIQFPYVIESEELNYSFGGSATAGALIKWFRDEFATLEKHNESLGGEDTYYLLDKSADSIKPGSEGIIVLPYFMGERSPIWNSNAKGVIFGLSIAHTRAHIYRAFLESVAFSLYHTMISTNKDVGDTIYVAGGVSNSKLWKQIIADVTGKKVVFPKENVEATLGDVILAGLGTKVLKIEDVKEWNVFENPIHPNKENHELYKQYFEIYIQIYENLKNEMSLISEIKQREV